jgi:hypothetical protein
LQVRLFNEIARETPVFHGFIVKVMLGFFIFPRPDQAFVAGSKIFAGNIRGGIGLEPDYIIQDMVALQHQVQPARINAVVCSGNPNRAVGL